MGDLELIAGSYAGVQGPASTFSPVTLINAKLKAGGTAEFDFPSHHKAAVVIISGTFNVNGREVVPTILYCLKTTAHSLPSKPSKQVLRWS